MRDLRRIHADAARAAGCRLAHPLLPLVLIAHRVSRLIQQLTAALTDFAGGDWSRRLETGEIAVPPRDEVTRAVAASSTWRIASPRRTASGSCT